MSPDENKEKGKGVETPAGAGARTTPFGTPAPTDQTTEMDLDTPGLQALGERFELQAEVGRGGMGIVYRARDRETDEVVAVKVLKPEIAGRPELIERFKAELRLARKITHKNICRTHDLHRFGTTAAISMEFVEGESLRAVLQKCETLSIRHGFKILRQVIAGLREAHAQGVVHRDLKPENIVIARDGTAKVMDFGIARSLETGATGTGTIVGTPAYMSPEQAEGKPADPRSDIYALGLILYEMFTGSPAFQGDTPVAVAVKQIQETPPPPRELEPTLPAHIEKAIIKSLGKKPAKRFQSVDELEAALLKGEEAKPVGAEAPAEVPLPLHLARWQRFDWLLLGAGIVGAVVFFGIYGRVYPYGAIRAPMTRPEAIEKTRSLVEKYAPERKEQEYKAFFVGADALLEFPQLVLAHGLSGASMQLEDFGTSWYVNAERAPGTVRSLSAAGFTSDGRLRWLNLGPPAEQPGNGPAPVEEVLPQATQVAEELLGLRVSGVPPQALVYDSRARSWRDTQTGVGEPMPAPAGSTTPVIWHLPGRRPNTTETVRVLMYRGRLGGVWHEVRLPREVVAKYGAEARTVERRWSKAFLFGFLGTTAYALLCLFLLIFRRAYAHGARTVKSMGVLGALAVLGMGWGILSHELSGGFLWLGVALVLVLGFLGNYGLIAVAHHYLWRRLPAHLKSASHLFSQGFRAQPAGLAMVRGTFLGALYLTLHTGVLLALGEAKWGATSSLWLGLAREAESPLVGLGMSFLSAVLAAWLLVALPATLVRGVTARIRWLVAGVTLFWVVLAFNLPGASAYPMLPLYLFAGLQGLFFSVVFLRYDLLTCLFAMLTVETWLLCYPLFRVFGGPEPWSYGLGLAPWFLLALLGVAIWFRPQLVGARKRLAAVFE